MIIRRELDSEHSIVYHVVQSAFNHAEHADGNEADLVNALRAGASYIPELSLVAVDGEEVVGHIMFTRASVGGASVLALAPLSVVPGRQGEGVGSALVSEGHRIAAEMGFSYSVVLGSESYYPRFGYLPADTFGIAAPFDVPRENFMACRLDPDAPEISGVMEYAEEFGIE